MNKLIVMAVAAAALATAPAHANEFGGVYVEGVAGVENVVNGIDTNDVTYGANAGINVPVGNFILGAELNANNVFDNRDIGASARIGYAAGRVMPYLKAGYANYRDAFSRNLDGLRVGGGLEYRLSDTTYIKAEYRYSDFAANVGKHGVLAGIGFRF